MLVDVDMGIGALRLALRCVLNPRAGVIGDCGARSGAGDDDDGFSRMGDGERLRGKAEVRNERDERLRGLLDG